jgi:hypothetical protein
MNIEEIERARMKIGQLARDMLEGKVSFVEGARRVWRLGSDARLPESDPDLTTFRGIESETDSLPIGKVRDLWATDALERLRPEIERAEDWAKQFGRTACQNLVNRFSGVVGPAASG